MSQRCALSAAGVGAAAAQGGDTAVRGDALEPGDDHDLALLQARLNFVRVDAGDARLGMDIVGVDGDLPTLPGSGGNADILQRQGKQARRHLFAGGDDGVVFPGVIELGNVIHITDELIGHPGHGRYHHGDLMARVDLGFDALRHRLDTVDVGYRSAAEFLHDQRHETGVSPDC